MPNNPIFALSRQDSPRFARHVLFGHTGDMRDPQMTQSFKLSPGFTAQDLQSYSSVLSLRMIPIIVYHMISKHDTFRVQFNVVAVVPMDFTKRCDEVVARL